MGILISFNTAYYEETTFADINLFFFFQFYLTKNHVFLEEDIHSEKVVIVEKELDGNAINDIKKLEDLLRLVFIDEECWNLKVVK